MHYFAGSLCNFIFKRFYVDSVALFRIDENGNEVAWWRGISVEDIIAGFRLTIIE